MTSIESSTVPESKSALSVGYREAPSQRRGAWWTMWSIARWNLKVIMRHKLFWAIVVVGLLPFLVSAVLIYLKAVLSADAGVGKFVAQYIEVKNNGASFRGFLNWQQISVMMVLTYAGLAVVMSDFRMGGLVFFFSKPLEPSHYLSGKLLALSIMTAILTFLPCFFLYILYGVFSNETTDYWIPNFGLVIGMAGASLVIMLSLGLLTLAVSAVFKSPSAFVLVEIGMILGMEFFSRIMSMASDSSYWLLVSLWSCIRISGNWFFDDYTRKDEDMTVIPAAIIVTLQCIVCYLLVMRKLKPVEVVS